MKNPKLPHSITSKIDYSLLHSTRVHRLPSDNRVWIKREDELSSSISGSKLRKYASLIPYLKENEIELAGMIGGPNSNNLVGLSQLLRENGIKPLALIREAADKTLQGNSLLLKLLLNENEIAYIPRNKWSEVEGIALEKLDRIAKKTVLLAEGCFGPEALLGTLSLAEGVVENELHHNLNYDRIYIDCGTGLSAIGLILGLEILDPDSCGNREIVVTLISESKSSFLGKIEMMRNFLKSSEGLNFEQNCRIVFKRPSLSPKYGSVNSTLFKECRKMAQSDGLLMDPTYSVKHFFAMKQDLAERPPGADSLFVFNGSALGLMGFQKQLSLT